MFTDLLICSCVCVFMFNFSPTAKVIWRLSHCLKSNWTDCGATDRTCKWFIHYTTSALNVCSFYILVFLYFGIFDILIDDHICVGSKMCEKIYTNL